MAIKKLFKATLPSCFYAFKDGSLAYFNSGCYATDKESEIEELNKVVADKSKVFYIDEKESEIDTNYDPAAAYKTKVIQEFLASQAAANNTKNDRGASKQSDNLNMANAADFLCTNPVSIPVAPEKATAGLAAALAANKK